MKKKPQMKEKPQMKKNTNEENIQMKKKHK